MSGHRILTGRTRLTGPGGRAYVLTAGDVLPDWAVGRVGEHLLQPEETPEPADQQDGEQDGEGTGGVEPAPPEQETDPAADLDKAEPDGRGKTSLTPPPKGGTGSGKEEWADYARANDVQVSDDDERRDIIAALEAAGVPTDAGN